MEKGHTINVLDKGFVRYVDHSGSDQRIVEAARISYKSPSKGEEQDKRLLRYLFKNRHTSPFEQVSITFNIKFPIFVMRQFVRHRTFRLNEWSARYSEMADDFYVPTEWRAQDNKNKQGSVQSADLNHSAITDSVHELCAQSYSLYDKLLQQGVAKEMARMVLPVNLYTEIYVNCDLHNLMHFLNLRLDSHAQYEIRVFAQAMFDIAKELFPWSMDAFGRYKWVVTEQ